MLCGGAHPANAKICRVYLEIIRRRFPSTNGAALQTLQQQTETQQQKQSQKKEYSTLPNTQSSLLNRNTAIMQQQSNYLPVNPPRSENYNQVPANASKPEHTINPNNILITFLQNTVSSQQQTINQLSAEIKRLNDKIDKLTEILLQKKDGNGSTV